MLSSRIDSFSSLESDWTRLLRSCGNGIRGPDATCSAAWITALSQTNLRGCEIRAHVVASDSQIVSIVPVHIATVPALPFPRRELRVVTEANAGRCGILALDDAPDVVEFVLGRLASDIAGWDVFRFSVVEGSRSHVAVARAARRLSLRVRCIAAHESPYIEFGGSWEELASRLPKKMRWTIRKAEKDLRAMGRLDYEEARDPASVDALLAAIHDIERRSWKESSGTSITTNETQRAFYESFAAVAARSGLLSGHVLRLDGRPIAYVLGIDAGDGVFLDLKESFDASYAEQSPGHVLKRFAFETLIARGIATYDFMGACEPYKMRWTDRTYRSLGLALFNPGARGTICYLRSRLGGASTTLPEPDAGSSARK